MIGRCAKEGVGLPYGLGAFLVPGNHYDPGVFCIYRCAGTPSLQKKREIIMGDKGTSAGARHGSNPSSEADRASNPSGLNERTGEFNIGEKIVFGARNGNILLRHTPQGDEVEVSESTLAGLMIDAFFSGSPGKLGDKYKPVQDRP